MKAPHDFMMKGPVFYAICTLGVQLCAQSIPVSITKCSDLSHETNNILLEWNMKGIWAFEVWQKKSALIGMTVTQAERSQILWAHSTDLNTSFVVVIYGAHTPSVNQLLELPTLQDK